MKTEDQMRLERMVFEEQMPFNILLHVQTRERMRDLNFHRHWHREIEINYVSRGCCNYIVAGEHRQVKAGEFIVVNSGQVHAVEPVYDPQHDGKVSAVSIIINPEFLRWISRDLKSFRFDASRIQDSAPVVRLFETLIEQNGIGDEFCELNNIAVSAKIIHAFCAQGALIKDPKRDLSTIADERIREILTYVEDHLEESLQASQVADRFYISRSYFNKIFKHYTSLSFKEYLLLARLEKAEKLLHGSSMNITQIALECGFGDSRRFIEAFKKKFDMTPNQFRKKTAHEPTAEFL